MTESPASEGCGLTVLHTVGSARATKEWRWNPHLKQWQKISYQAGTWFVPVEHRVADLAGLVSVLDTVRRDPCAFVVRGALAPKVAEAVAANPRHRIRRRKLKKNDIEPTLLEMSRSWVMLDVDNWPLRTSDDLAADPASAVEAAIHALLPEAFQSAVCWWQLSASAGFTPGFLKVHLFFWLAEPASNEHIKLVLRQHAPGITDRSPFSAAQPHFVADPIIAGGHDPLPCRTGWRHGREQAVKLPALVVPTPGGKPRQSGQAKPSSPGTPRAKSGSIGLPGGEMDALAFLGDGEPGEGWQGFHEPLRTATMRYAKRCSRYNDRDDEALKHDLRERIRAAPRSADRNVEADYTSDNYLDRLIAGAFALLAGDAEIQTMRPHHAPAVDTLEEARAALTKHVGGFFDRALKFGVLDEAERANTLPEHAALVVGVGTGKSTAARKALPAFIAAAKAAGQPHRVLWLVPHHKLGNETLEAMLALGIKAEVMRGRDAVLPGSGNPENYAEPQRMCLNLDAVNDALSVHANVESSVCGSDKEHRLCCPWRNGPNQCAFQRQKAPVALADVVITAHQSLFYELAKKVRANLGVVIVDESWWQAGLIPQREINLDTFAQEPAAYPVRETQKILGSVDKARLPAVNTDATGDLRTWSEAVQKAVDCLSKGDLISKAAVASTGLTAQNCASAYTLEWRRLVEGAIYPGQSIKDRRKLMELAAGNASIPRRAAFWRALQALLEGDETHTGRLQMSSRTTINGSFRTIILHSRFEVREEIAGLPMLHLDATMPLEVVRHFLPRLEVLAEIYPAAPHMRVHQVVGGWGKTSLVPHDKADAAENRRRAGLVQELSDFAALNSGGNGAVLTYHGIEPVFDRHGLRTGHFNAYAGLDTMKDVRSLFVIGRPLPDARDLRSMALALTGRAIPEDVGQVETRGALMADGTGSALNVRAYADKDLEALRVAVTEAAIIQAIGRCRGVTRTALNPVDVFLFADVATPLPITRMVRWADIRPNVLNRMASRGLVLLGATDAARIYTDLFPTPDAARMARGRAGGEADFPNISLREYLYIGECSGNRLVPVTYRPAGRGQQTRGALVAADRLETLAEWLTDRLDAPVRVEVSAVQPEAAVAPAPPERPSEPAMPQSEFPAEGGQAPAPFPMPSVPWPRPPVPAYASTTAPVLVRHPGGSHSAGAGPP